MSTATHLDPSAGTPAMIDARAPRFTAAVTAVVLALVLVASQFDLRAAAVMLAVQMMVFAVGAHFGPQRHPYTAAYRRLIAPRLGPATKNEAVEPLRFAQMLGVFFCGVGVAGFALGAPVVGYVATGFALFAALMRAVFGVCLGRGPYIVVTRMRGQVPACCQNK